jgi:hypothetical protein
MRLRSAATLFAAACLLAPASSRAATDRHITVTVEQAADTAEGSQLAFLVKERFRQSALFYLAENAPSGGFRIKLNVVAIGSTGALAYSATVTASGGPNSAEYYLNNWEGWCGINRLEDCSAEIYRLSAAYAEQFSDYLARSLRETSDH